jgi:hypothetical protein
MSDVYWVWRNVARWVRSALDLATRGLRGRSPNRLGLNLSVDHEDLPRRTATSRRARPRWRRSRRAGAGSERRGQAGWRLDSERTAPVKANQRLTVANPRPRRHWAAKVISATGKPGEVEASSVFRALMRYEVKQHDFKMFEADS